MERKGRKKKERNRDNNCFVGRAGFRGDAIKSGPKIWRGPTPLPACSRADAQAQTWPWSYGKCWPSHPLLGPYGSKQVSWKQLVVPTVSGCRFHTMHHQSWAQQAARWEENLKCPRPPHVRMLHIWPCHFWDRKKGTERKGGMYCNLENHGHDPTRQICMWIKWWQKPFAMGVTAPCPASTLDLNTEHQSTTCHERNCPTFSYCEKGKMSRHANPHFYHSPLWWQWVSEFEQDTVQICPHWAAWLLRLLKYWKHMDLHPFHNRKSWISFLKYVYLELLFA